MADQSDYDDVEEQEIGYIGDEFSTNIEMTNPRVKNYKPGGNFKL